MTSKAKNRRIIRKRTRRSLEKTDIARVGNNVNRLQWGCGLTKNLVKEQKPNVNEVYN